MFLKLRRVLWGKRFEFSFLKFIRHADINEHTIMEKPKEKYLLWQGFMFDFRENLLEKVF